jgi:hypothetical protein
MKGVARISFPGGGLLVPAKTPYEREVLFEHVHEYTKRHGQVRVELNGRAWLVRLHTDPAVPCTGCSQLLENLSYSLPDRTWCPACVRRSFR